MTKAPKLLTHPITLRQKLLGSAASALLLTAQGAWAETGIQGCDLVNGAIPPGCSQANAGNVVSRPVPPNVEQASTTSAVGDLGFSISIDPVSPDAGKRTTIAGETLRHDDTRDMDRLLDQLGLQMTYDGLGAKPLLNVSTTDMRRSYVAGDPVSFRASTNYPAWLTRAEVRVVNRKKPSEVVAVLPVAANGSVTWAMPGDGAEDMLYTLRVYDGAGRYDETIALPLARTAKRFEEPELDGPIIAAGEGEDRTARRRIPVRGGAVTVTGQDVPEGTTITVMGEPVIPDLRRTFVMQRILPPGDHGVRIGVDPSWGPGTTVLRPVSIPKHEWFTTGIIDVTVGRDLEANESFQYGRIAGFAQGVLSDGTKITAAVDTEEEELRDMFRDFGRKRPNRVLDQIDPEDVFVTTGDDSVTEDLAPTSGKFYLRADKDRSHLMWGDYQPNTDVDRLVRSDRALYGVEGVYESPAVTKDGEARIKVSGFGAQPDTLVQRDVFRGTGGSAYFLSRQDIQDATETLMVETRDPVTGLVVGSRRLTEGTDYRIDYVQGVIILNAPLSASASNAGLVTDRPLGDYDVNLVAQYEYVPTTGSVDGYTYGGRAEAWVSDQLRLGFSGVSETTGVADNQLLGADLLFRHSDETYVELQYATSEGPGFGSTFSLNSGMEIDPANPTAGISGKRAEAYRLEGSVDLQDFGAEGYIKGFYDRKEAGFSSPDDEIEVTQDAFGLDGQVRVSARADLTFGYESFSDDADKRQDDGRIGLIYELSDHYSLAGEIAHTDRSDPLSTLDDDNGTRTDVGAKLTWKRDEDLSLWIFGQATAQRTGDLAENNRLGAGVQTRLNDKLTFTGEASGGNLGAAGTAELAYQPNAGTTYNLGYRLDPTRALDSSTMSGRDNGSFVVGATSIINDAWSYRTENTYSAFGSEPSQAATYGVVYTPSDVWQYQGGFELGTSVETDGTEFERKALSFGARYTNGELMTAGLRGELRKESSDNPARDLDRDTYLLSGFVQRSTSEDWRFLANIDAVISNSDQSSFRDGRYVEARLGYAYRPVNNDRLNALISYTYLYDLPGADQVNIDGDINGDKQRSHIINAALSYDLNQQWTLGAKYGYRLREQALRGTDTFTKSEAHLGIVRLDYEVVNNWDLMIEGRSMYFANSKVDEYGLLAGVYRDIGNNLRIGGGYSWGKVSDDLRTIDQNREGVFLNVIGKF